MKGQGHAVDGCLHAIQLRAGITGKPAEIRCMLEDIIHVITGVSRMLVQRTVQPLQAAMQTVYAVEQEQIGILLFR